MAKSEQAYYEHYRRQHRHLGAYLALQLWNAGYDGVIIDRAALATFHELKRFTEEHLSWLTQDIKPYFPHHIKCHCSKTKNKFASLVLSRVPLTQDLGATPLTDSSRAAKYRALGVRIASLIEIRTLHRPFTEKNIVSFLALVACGLDSPRITHVDSLQQKVLPKPKL